MAGPLRVYALGGSILAPNGPDIAYAMIFPGMTIIKILFVDIVPVFFRG